MFSDSTSPQVTAPRTAPGAMEATRDPANTAREPSKCSKFGEMAEGGKLLVTKVGPAAAVTGAAATYAHSVGAPPWKSLEVTALRPGQ